MTAVIDSINSILWGYVLVYGLLAAGVYFTIMFGFVQIRYFGDVVRAAIAGAKSGESGQGITPFQALCTSLASRVGTGNIAGVAIAIVLGGPGALFWMWMMALLGMATAFAEAVLAQLYKTTRPGQEGALYAGGPAHYIARGLGMPWVATFFAILLVIGLGLVMNALQSSAISDAMLGAFGVERGLTGVILAVLTGMVIFGGVRGTARVAEYIVPFMAGAYLLITLWVVVLNITEVPHALWLVVSSAFGYGQLAGGVAGGIVAAMLNGVKRGIFSNEAGMGSAPNIAAAAEAAHPVSQGLVQIFGVFIDTIVVCTCTGLIILLSGVYVPGGELTGTQLTQEALAEHIGSVGPVFVALALFFFAFTTILGSYSYAEMAMSYLKLDTKWPLRILRSIAVLVVLWGSMQTIDSMFNFADATLGLLALINVIAVLFLSPKVTALVRDWRAQKRKGVEPRFVLADHPQLAKGADPEIWR